MPESKDFFSVPETAAILGISRIAVFKKVKKGQLPAIRVGRNWAVPFAALRHIRALPATRAERPPLPATEKPRPPTAAPATPPRPTQPPDAADGPAGPESAPHGDSDMNDMGWD